MRVSKMNKNFEENKQKPKNKIVNEIAIILRFLLALDLNNLL